MLERARATNDMIERELKEAKTRSVIQVSRHADSLDRHTLLVVAAAE